MQVKLFKAQRVDILLDFQISSSKMDSAISKIDNLTGLAVEEKQRLEVIKNLWSELRETTNNYFVELTSRYLD